MLSLLMRRNFKLGASMTKAKFMRLTFMRVSHLLSSCHSFLISVLLAQLTSIGVSLTSLKEPKFAKFLLKRA
jgi:hypothetical protein